MKPSVNFVLFYGPLVFFPHLKLFCPEYTLQQDNVNKPKNNLNIHLYSD